MKPSTVLVFIILSCMFVLNLLFTLCVLLLVLYAEEIVVFVELSPYTGIGVPDFVRLHLTIDNLN